MLYGMEYPFGQSSLVEYNEKLKNLALYITTQQ